MKKAFVLLPVVIGVAVSMLAPLAVADDPFDLTVTGGAVTIATKGHWHVNKEYPWKVVSGETIFDKSKFAFTETSAIVTGLPRGAARLKGAVCDGPHCVPFTTEIMVQ
jgi:hypothetical protein